MIRPTVLLCNPPVPDHTVADREAAYGVGAWLNNGEEARAPHTLAWCGALLCETGWQVEGVDAVAEGLNQDECLAVIGDKEATLVVLLSSPTTAQSDLEFVRALREYRPTVRLLLIGLATRYLPHSLVEAADMVLTGEPEGAIVAACRTLLVKGSHQGESSPEALNVSGYDGRGHLRDLDWLPPPAWELFPLEKYSTLPIVASRGCAYGCRYCVAPITQGRSTRFRSPEQVAKEMYGLNSQHGVRRFHLSDPLFAANREQAEVLCDALIRLPRPRGFNWSCETRPEQLDLWLLQKMKRAGCKEIHLGLESVSPEILIAIGRLPDPHAVQSYLTRVREIVLGCRVFEIDCHLHVIAGLPGSRSGASVTRTFLRAYSSQPVQVSPLTPYPGTSIFPTNQLEQEIALLREVPMPEEPPQTEPVRLHPLMAP